MSKGKFHKLYFRAIIIFIIFIIIGEMCLGFGMTPAMYRFTGNTAPFAHHEVSRGTSLAAYATLQRYSEPLGASSYA